MRDRVRPLLLGSQQLELYTLLWMPASRDLNRHSFRQPVIGVMGNAEASQTQGSGPTSPSSQAVIGVIHNAKGPSNVYLNWTKVYTIADMNVKWQLI